MSRPLGILTALQIGDALVKVAKGVELALRDFLEILATMLGSKGGFVCDVGLGAGGNRFAKSGAESGRVGHRVTAADRSRTERPQLSSPLRRLNGAPTGTA
jgi:hypothetical protein